MDLAGFLLKLDSTRIEEKAQDCFLVRTERNLTKVLIKRVSLCQTQTPRKYKCYITLLSLTIQYPSRRPDAATVLIFSIIV